MKKSILVVLAVFLLASSLAMVSCGDGGTGSNKFVGTWVTSSFNSNNTSLGPATLKFTSSEWALTVPGAGINEKGSYTFGSIDAYAYLNQIACLKAEANYVLVLFS